MELDSSSSSSSFASNNNNNINNNNNNNNAKGYLPEYVYDTQVQFFKTNTDKDLNTLHMKVMKPEFSPYTEHYIKQLYITYLTIEDSLMAFFNRINFITIKQGDQIIQHMSGPMWSTYLTIREYKLNKKQVFKNSSKSQLYIPLPCEGLTNNIQDEKLCVTISISFIKFEQEETRVSVFSVFQPFSKHASLSSYYWKFTPMVRIPLSDFLPKDDIESSKSKENQEKKSKLANTLQRINLDIFAPNTKIAQLWFHIPNSGNGFIESGALAYYNQQVKNPFILQTFKDGYHAVSIDKALSEIGIAQQGYFTFTLCNWFEKDPTDDTHIKNIVKQDDRFCLLLKFQDNIKNVEIPPDACIELFGVVAVPR